MTVPKCVGCENKHFDTKFARFGIVELKLLIFQVLLFIALQVIRERLQYF